tara:strand:+ start:208 stop:444 length:237 start_codon:yes stop_codon:yes gene_type:complete
MMVRLPVVVLVTGLNGNDVELAETAPALGAYRIGQCAHGIAFPLEHHAFHAVIMVQSYRGRRRHEGRMGMLQFRKTHG